MKTSLYAGRYKAGSKKGRMVRTCAVALVVALVLAPVLAASAGESDEGVREVEHMPINSPKDRNPSSSFFWSVGGAPLIINPASRRGYQLFEIDGPSWGVALMNIDTYQQIAYQPLMLLEAGQSSGTIPHAVDESNRRLFVGIKPFTATSPVVGIIDERLLEQNKNPFLKLISLPSSQVVVNQSLVPFLGSWRVRGMSLFVDPATGRQKLLLTFEGFPTNGTYVAQWDVERAIQGTSDWGDWLQLYPDCNDTNTAIRAASAVAGDPINPTTDFTLLNGMPVGRSYSAPYAYFSCVGTTGMKAVRIRLLGPNGTPDFTETFQGPAGQTSVTAFLDSKADRMHMIGAIARFTENRVQEMWSIDMISGRLVGKVGITNEGATTGQSFGMDPHTGRVYGLLRSQVVDNVFISGGLVVIDGRLSPVPQSLFFPQYAGSANVPIAIDPPAPGRPRRIFFRRGSTERNYHNPQSTQELKYSCPQPPNGSPKACLTDTDWVVLQDKIPVPVVPDLADLDRFTVNVAEQEGATGSSFEGSGGSYAARLKLVRGFAGAWTQGPSDSVWTLTGPPNCWTYDRVITAASVEEAKLNSYQSAGKASPLLADGATHLDLEDPASRCEPPKRPHQLAPGVPSNPFVSDSTIDLVIKSIDGALGRDWPAESAACLQDGNQTKEFSVVPFASKANVTCGAKESRGDARASFNLADVVRIADGGSQVTVQRNTAHGVEVRSEAWVSGVSIDLGDTTLSIDKVRAVATVWSNGRPSATPRGKYVRTICGVRTGDGDPTPCFTEEIKSATCTVQAPHPDHRAYCSDSTAFFVAGINRILGARGSARLNTPDFKYVNGSPGGYVVAVQKSAGQFFDDSVRNGDYSFEMPAFEIVVERLSGRHIISLAAIKAAATYGIYQLPKELAFSDDTGGIDSLEDAYLGEDGFGSSELGSSLALPSLTNAQSGSGSGGNVIKRFFQSLLQRALLFRSLKEGALAAAVWLSLLLPAVLVSRRVSVLRSIGVG